MFIQYSASFPVFLLNLIFHKQILKSYREEHVVWVGPRLGHHGVLRSIQMAMMMVFFGFSEWFVGDTGTLHPDPSQGRACCLSMRDTLIRWPSVLSSSSDCSSRREPPPLGTTPSLGAHTQWLILEMSEWSGHLSRQGKLWKPFQFPNSLGCQWRPQSGLALKAWGHWFPPRTY